MNMNLEKINVTVIGVGEPSNTITIKYQEIQDNTVKYECYYNYVVTGNEVDVVKSAAAAAMYNRYVHLNREQEPPPNSLLSDHHFDLIGESSTYPPEELNQSHVETAMKARADVEDEFKMRVVELLVELGVLK